MESVRLSRPSPAMVVALVALFVALTGSAVAVDRAGKKVPANSVGTKQLKTGAVTPPDIQQGAITPPALRPGAVTAPAIANEAVTSPAIANEAVTTTALAPEAVIPGKIKPGAVTSEKLSPNSVGPGNLQPNSVLQGSLAPGSLIESKFSQNLPRVGVSLTTPLGVGAGPISGTIYTENATPDFATEAYDTRSMHVTTGVDKRNLVAPVDGLYRATLNAKWANAAGTARAVALHHAKASCGFCHNIVGDAIGPPSTGGQTAQSVSVVVEMEANDNIFVDFASIGAPAQVDSASFSLEWIGPPTG